MNFIFLNAKKKKKKKIYFCNVYLIHLYTCKCHFSYCTCPVLFNNPNSAMSILHDGMCALEESTIIIIVKEMVKFKFTWPCGPQHAIYSQTLIYTAVIAFRCTYTYVNTHNFGIIVLHRIN